MAIKLDNTSEYLGNRGDTDYWEWTLFIDCSGNDNIEDIEYVEYHLHPTFENSVIRRRSSKKLFSLTRTGWGVFEVQAIVVFRDSARDPKVLKHMLKFS